jgi:hypothetical protein
VRIYLIEMFYKYKIIEVLIVVQLQLPAEYRKVTSIVSSRNLAELRRMKSDQSFSSRGYDTSVFIGPIWVLIWTKSIYGVCKASTLRD